MAGRMFSDMQESDWHPLYDKCMQMADRAGKAEYASIPKAERMRMLRKQGFFYSHAARYWVDIWRDFAKGKIDEEALKATFHAEYEMCVI